MPDPSLVSWTAVITGLAHSSSAFAQSAVLDLFREFQQQGLNPENVCYTAVLVACSHRGTVDDIQRYFRSMSEDYNLVASPEHYCVMVDCLARAGYLDRALEMVESLPFVPAFVGAWTSLLAACRIHRNLYYAERVASRIQELNLNSTASYMLLSNTYKP